MDEHIKEIYASLSETAFYILVCVRHANHGYWITTMVASMTNS